MDSRFNITPLRQTLQPQQLIYMAMHQDYSPNFIVEELGKVPSEAECGELVVKHLLKGGKGHYGPLEHPQITLACGYFPHSLMQQLRTHRVGISFDVQSFRYTSQQIVDVAHGRRELEDVFYFRPVSFYTDRNGNKYDYTQEWRECDMERALDAAAYYADEIEAGKPPEHARSLVPFDIRQHWVMSVNMRSLMHLLDLRSKSDAQLEAQWFCELLYLVFVNWCPDVAHWYYEHRYAKARLAP